MKAPIQEKTPPATQPKISKSPASKYRILLVDDHPITRQGVAVLLNQERDLEVVGEADSAPAAIAFLQKNPVDLAIIDITLKTTNGVELMKHIRVLAPDMPVLVMSMHDESIYAERAMRAGARGYIMKQEASGKILTAVRAMLAGDLYLSDRMKERVLHRFVNNRKEDTVGFSMDTLSDREMEVFQLIGEGYSTRQIAAKLNLSVKTIDSYREHLKLKLQLEAGKDLVRYAIQWMKSEPGGSGGMAAPA